MQAAASIPTMDDMHGLMTLYAFALVAVMLTAVIGAYLLPPDDEL